jgi:hypothetical protein
MFDRIRLWWKYEGRYYRKNFIRGIKNLWKWFPTIWKDRDYDSNFIYEVLRIKLENQAYYIEHKGIHVDAERDAERMLLCARLIQIQQEELYETEYLDYLKRDHQFIPTDETNQWYTLESTTIKDDLDKYFEKYPKQHKQALSGKINYFDLPVEEKDRYTIAMEIAQHNQERSRKLLFKIIEQHIEEWWD